MIESDTSYKMWYSGSQDTVRSIGYATSGDGVTWTKYSGNPVLNVSDSGWDDTVVNNPFVLRHNITYKMWYSGHNGFYIKIGYATNK